jgi:hypothetical protein
MLKTVLAVLTLLVSAVFLVQPRAALADGGPRTELRLEARMKQGVTEGKAAYRLRSGVRTLQAEINRAAPNTQYAVTFKGSTIATITTNDLGVGRVELTASGTSTAVPNLAAGDAVGIGVMSGVLAPR